MNAAQVRDRLMAERGHAEGRIVALDAEFRGLVDAGDGTNIDDEHDPEGATIAFERAQVSALLEQARERLAELDRALLTLETRGPSAYASCENCGRPIAAGRLEARPSARTCIDCA